MEKEKQDEEPISVTAEEAALIPGILRTAKNRLYLNPDQKRLVDDFLSKLRKAGLSISKRYLDSLANPKQKPLP